MIDLSLLINDNQDMHHIKYLLIICIALGLPAASWALSVVELPELTGEITGDRAGYSMATGDLNGDGYDDLLVGATGYHSSGGAVYITYGGEDLITDASLSSADTILSGINSAEVGSDLATGDLNGDGYDDAIIAAWQYTDNGNVVGSVYVVYGQSAALSSMQLSSKQGTQIIGLVASAGFGSSVTAADLNNDGADELLIGAPQYGDSDAGAVYLFYGTVGAELADATVSASSTILQGENTGDYLGSDVANAGDVNGDGYADVTIGASRSEEGRSRVWLVYGRAAEYSAGSIGDIAIRFNNEVDDDQVGSVGYGGDINNDGYDDMIAGAPQHHNGSYLTAGAAYVLPGKASSYANGTFSTAIHYYGAASNQQVGVQVAGGDTNGDGYSDLLIGTQPNNETGQAYLVYGSDSLISLSSLESQLTIDGEEVSDRLGNTLAMGDLNNDGYDEMILGANGRLSQVGSVYILYSTVDTDGDGLAGTDGILFDGADTNDNDFDNDGITDDQDTTVDTSYEIPGDGYDNDGDGTVDEDNTLEENGTHTGYDLLDPNDADTASATLISARGRKHGKIKVTYSDDSSYVYTIFNHTSTRKTKVKQYNQLGYLVVYQSTGKKLALVNAYTGEVYNRKAVNRKARRYVGLLLADVRGDDQVEAVVTNRKGSAVQVALYKVNTTTQKLKKRSSLKLTDATVNPSKTRKKRNKILLRNSHSKVHHRLNTNARYKLSLLD